MKYNLYRVGYASSSLPIPFLPLYMVAVMAVKAQPNPEESWTGFPGECGWWTWLGELSLPGSMPKILFMLTLGLKSLPTHLEWTYTSCSPGLG